MADTIAGVGVEERTRYSSLSLVHSHRVKHNFLFTFLFPELLNNAPGVYISIDTEREMEQKKGLEQDVCVSAAACVCFLFSVTASEVLRLLFWFTCVCAAVQSAAELGEVKRGSQPVLLLVSLL